MQKIKSKLKNSKGNRLSEDEDKSQRVSKTIELIKDRHNSDNWLRKGDRKSCSRGRKKKSTKMSIYIYIYIYIYIIYIDIYVYICIYIYIYIYIYIKSKTLISKPVIFWFLPNL